MKWSTLCVGLAALGLSACSVFDANTLPELPPLAGSNQLSMAWKVGVGSNEVALQTNFSPAMYHGETVFALNQSGVLTVLDAHTGERRQRLEFKEKMTAGAAVDELGVYAVNEKGALIALSLSGELRWSQGLGALPVGRPQLAVSRVLVQTQDGRVQAFDHQSGKLLWNYHYHVPALVLQHSGSLQVLGEDVALLGVSGGRVVVLDLARGEPILEAPISATRGANELERMADIVSPPVFDGKLVCASAFQGRTSCLDARTGAPVWSQAIASSRGLAVSARGLFVVAQDGGIHALDRNTGQTLWVQTALKQRQLSAPTILGSSLFVMDDEGGAHLISQSTGELIGRLDTKSGGMATRAFATEEMVFVQTRSGDVMAFRHAQ